MQTKDAKTHPSPGVPGGLRGVRGQRPLVSAAPTGALMQAHSKKKAHALARCVSRVHLRSAPFGLEAKKRTE